MFQTLSELIQRNNQKYDQLNIAVNDAEAMNDGSAEAETKINKANFDRWQFIHDYATEISDLILHNLADLKKSDLSPLDLVPYTVWNKIPKKTVVIVTVINNL